MASYLEVSGEEGEARRGREEEGEAKGKREQGGRGQTTTFEVQLCVKNSSRGKGGGRGRKGGD